MYTCKCTRYNHLFYEWLLDLTTEVRIEVHVGTF